MLPVRKIRDLTLEAAQGDEHSANVSAASALVHLGSTLFVIADDEKQLSIFPDEARTPGYQIQILSGKVPGSDEERAKTKPDLESLEVLPPWDGSPWGSLISLASGTKHRDRAVLIPLGPDQMPTGDSHELDVSPLYDELRSKIDGFNIEGCAVRGDTLHLFQRGNSEGSKNARIDLSIAAVQEAVAESRPIVPQHVIGIANYDLGQLQGVKLCFSDASPLSDGRLVFTCSAETSGGGGDDGRIAGSAIGMMERDGKVSMVEPVDLEVKIEGMTAMMVDDAIRVLLVTDGDDPTSPSPLMEAMLPQR